MRDYGLLPGNDSVQPLLSIFFFLVTKENDWELDASSASLWLVVRPVPDLQAHKLFLFEATIFLNLTRAVKLGRREYYSTPLEQVL